MTKLLEIKNKIQTISNEFYSRVEGRNELYRKAENEIFHSAKKVVFSNLKYVMRLPQHADYDLTGVDGTIKQATIEGRALPSYNLANQFVWLKRHLRIVQKYTRIHNEFIRDFKAWDEVLGSVITDVKFLAPSKMKMILSKQANDLHAEIYAEWFGGGEIEPYEPIKGGTWIDALIHSEFKIAKHDALQFLTLEHDDLYTLQQVATVPDELDRDSFEELIFIAKAEKDTDSLFFYLYLERMMKALDASKELREKTWDAFTETFGPVQTYNGRGNMVSRKPIKPNLKVITND